MKDFLKRIKADFLASSILCIVLGIIFIICNDGVINLMGSVFAVILIIIGAVYVGSFYISGCSCFSGAPFGMWRQEGRERGAEG